MAGKDSDSNWWKQVLERGKKQEKPEAPHPTNEGSSAVSSEAPSGHTIPPSPETSPPSAHLEEQVDQVIASAASSRDDPAAASQAPEKPPLLEGKPSKARKSQMTWPPIKREQEGEGVAKPDPSAAVPAGQAPPPREDHPPEAPSPWRSSWPSWRNCVKASKIRLDTKSASSL